MSSKSSKGLLGGHHTAGIYADMSIDGPEIGTLVLIVDRARNLPNRKTMGKQDPYCAARLGKEAKKTDTDKRGGQTPRWYDIAPLVGDKMLMVTPRDQELRFTVHESPDYYQLKISVFNDDKRTELIGESWIALEKIIVAGGGQHDLWQTLNCKGRYAGEIRVELTYYDTRPREVQQEGKPQDTPLEDVVEDTRDRLAGPRQLKPVKRRPLPADPSSSSRSSPLAQTVYNLPQIPATNAYPTDTRETYGSPNRYDSQEANADPYGSPSQKYAAEEYEQPHNEQQHIDTTQGVPYSNHRPSSLQQAGMGSYEPLEENELSHSPVEEHPFAHNADYEIPSIPSSEPYRNYYEASQPNHLPNNIDPRLYGQPMRPNVTDNSIPPESRDETFCPVSPMSKNNSFDNSPNHHAYRRGTQDSWQSGVISPIQDQDEDDDDDDDIPPPPPAHGTGSQRQSIQMAGFRTPDSQSLVSTPAPLNVRHHRESASGSPLARLESAASSPPYTSMNPYLPSQSSSALTSNLSHSQVTRRDRARSPERDYASSMPPSLMPGYEPSVAADESERVLRDRHSYGQQDYREQHVPQYEQPTPAFRQSPQQAVPRSMTRPADVAENYAYRAAAPAIRPRAISPDAKRPIRKSVSPHPRPMPGETARSGIPFSPDSYDAFNPALNKSNSVNETGARYETPEQAVEASREAERQAKVGDAPIIGSDGRVIDPSDHLPTNTWAPEPEPKPVRKGPEVTLRFRHSPQGPQPLPSTGASTRTVITPSRIQQSMSVDNSPSSAHRIRLQKKSGMGSPQHHASSPAVPTLYSTPSPRNTMPRSSASDHAAHGSSSQENYAYGSSPGYNRNRSPGRSPVPPPVPSKVPIDGGYEDHGMSALSEEMSRIDIGIGHTGRPRRARF